MHFQRTLHPILPNPCPLTHRLTLLPVIYIGRRRHHPHTLPIPLLPLLEPPPQYLILLQQQPNLIPHLPYNLLTGHPLL